MNNLSSFDILLLASGFFWTLTYIFIIKCGFQDKTYGMPLFALSFNLSWEFIFSFIFPESHSHIQHIVDIVWLSFDVIILFQLFRYGIHNFPKLPTTIFYAVIGSAITAGFCSIFFIYSEIQDSGIYTAFGQNLLMSILFITMLYQRQSLLGQSIWVGIFKLLGTVFASLAFYLYPVPEISGKTALLPFLYISIFIYDSIYIGLIASKANFIFNSSNS
ncbi:MAG: hypothetical protein F6K11_36985 [Leptolyngbya sp. SIO3F4]|nr:hypothetical protein [Leptolyngbya sp. SIO3F4]